MLSELTLLRHLATVLCDRWRTLRADPEAGYTTETVIVTALLAVGGARLPLVVPVWGSLVLFAAGFVVPDLGIRADTARRRRDFRHALSSFLDLVVVALAGGGGVETALADAAGIGEGWAFAALRRALDQARLSRETPWAALARLGGDLGVGELS